MYAAARNLRGGGVSPRNTRPRGQSIIEYVLIIAIIGLVIVFAGPGVAGAIRNQFNLVGNTVNSETSAGTEGGGASGGGFTGTASTTVQAAIAKDAKDWTLGEQKAVAEDIAAKGEASPAYAKAKAAMDAGRKFSMKLTDGQTLEYKIIGINHDDLADGSGKAGLTFLTTSTGIKSCVNSGATNIGGWEKSEIRQKMNSGEIWNRLPSDFQSKVKIVKKLSNNVGGGPANKDAAVTATSDKLFLLSISEFFDKPRYDWGEYSWIGCEGTQYEAFKGKVTYSSANPSIANGKWWWIRSVNLSYTMHFSTVHGQGDLPYSSYADSSECVCPAWCF
ncbi:hypothetical protein DWZ15_03620 [Collinsella sp. AF29-7AC]|nr:hypothetical protein DWZ15_03620 [Collinsella sp. AF29-7AC]